MHRSLPLSFSLLILSISGFSQIPDSSRIPMVYINTGWQSIPDEPKIMCHMLALDNGYNQWNHITDTNYVYDGKVGLEKRGSISQLWPQNSYALETWNLDSTSNNVVLLGMPKENDWILYGPWDDHSLMKNVISFEIGRGMGYWAPRTKYCEFLLNTWIFPDYRGVYVMMEKIKRDNNRVDVAKLDLDDNAGDSLTGGYIIAVDRNIWGTDSGWTTPNNPPVFIRYVYPEGDEITPQQMNYIQQYVDSFENALLAPNFAHYTQGFRKYAEPRSFIDYFIITELSKNIDAYKRSSYMHKHKRPNDNRLLAGPFWDFNSAYGAQLCGFDSAAGWAYPMTCWVNQAYNVPFWWGRMLQDSVFTRDLKCRWTELRATILDTTNLFGKIDSIRNYIYEPAQRHFARWTLAGTFDGGVDTLKIWFRNRIAWMDANMPGNCWNLSTPETVSGNMEMKCYPNPTKGDITLELFVNSSGLHTITITDMLGNELMNRPESLIAGTNAVTLPTQDLSSGMYFIKVSRDMYDTTIRFIKY